MSVPSRYSHHARRAMTHAAALVARYRHAAVDTGHLLAGLMLTEGSIAYQVLSDMNLTFSRAEPHLKTMYAPVKPLPDEIVHNEALKNTLALAADEASWLNNHYIGSEHLLLALSRTNAGGADGLLKKLAVDPEFVRRSVRRALSDGMTEINLQYARRTAKLSELSRRVINAAESVSLDYDHPLVGVGHLLVALLNERRSPISRILRECGLDEDRLGFGLAARDPGLLASIEAPVLKALDLAESMGSHYTGTEHLMIPLTEGLIAMVLRQYGLNTAAIRERLSEYVRGDDLKKPPKTGPLPPLQE